MKPYQAGIYLFSLLIVLFMAMTVAYAQNTPRQSNFATAEDVALTFYKMGGLKPDFEPWIKARAPYNLTPLTRRPRVMAEQQERLGSLYQAINLKQHSLLINTQAEIAIHQLETGDYTLSSQFYQAPTLNYLPYVFLDQHYAIILNNIKTAMNGAITNNLYDFIDQNAVAAMPHYMTMRIKPVSVDIAKPQNINGTPHWLMSAEIEFLQITSYKNEVLWSYAAPLI